MDGNAYNRRAASSVGALALAAVITGCAPVPPAELVDARTAYDRARASDAADYAPADLAGAREDLQRAEGSFDEDGATFTTRSLAYIAVRSSQYAVTRAATLRSEQDKKRAEQRLVKTATRSAVVSNQKLAEKTDEARQAEARSTAEKAGRLEAELKAKESLDRLSEFASVREEPRGLVITLPGGVLFESGRAALIPLAKARLDEVADALLANRDGDIAVEGHTDTQGNDFLNDRLSQDRAAAVRDYLIGRGVAADRIKAIGRGSHFPVADNGSSEGRANNRRVEIVIDRSRSESEDYGL